LKKIILFALIFCVAGGALGVPGARASLLQGRGRAAVYYRDGTRYALEGRLNEAAAAFEQAVLIDPKDGDAFYSLGNVYAEQGRWADAVDAYRQTVVLKNKDGEAYNGLGIALGSLGQYEQAAAAFRSAVEIYPAWAAFSPEPRLPEARARRGRAGLPRRGSGAPARLRHTPPALFPVGTGPAARRAARGKGRDDGDDERARARDAAQ
jgi:tetratricopeptide (TPR) repeat protein